MKIAVRSWSKSSSAFCCTSACEKISALNWLKAGFLGQIFRGGLEFRFERRAVPADGGVLGLGEVHGRNRLGFVVGGGLRLGVEVLFKTRAEEEIIVDVPMFADPAQDFAAGIKERDVVTEEVIGWRVETLDVERFAATLGSVQA